MIVFMYLLYSYMCDCVAFILMYNCFVFMCLYMDIIEHTLTQANKAREDMSYKSLYYCLYYISMSLLLSLLQANKAREDMSYKTNEELLNVRAQKQVSICVSICVSVCVSVCVCLHARLYVCL